MKQPVYLDYNGTTPHHPEVISAMIPFLQTDFGNPSSGHWFGIAPKKALIKARRQVAELINCDPKEIIFTSGGTESNNWAIRGICSVRQQKGNHIITSSVEHPAVTEVCRFLEKFGFQTTYLPVDEFGRVSITDVEKAIVPQTILITIMHANNEVGTIQPIREISKLAKRNDIAFHTDAAQSCGKVITDVRDLGVDMLSIAGHKLYAPKGVGALYVRSGVELEKFMLGAGQENGKRAGTENVTQIVGLGKACEVAQRDFQENVAGMKRARDRLHEELSAGIDFIKLNGHPEDRLPNTLSISFKDLEANRILEEIGLDVAASAGAACHSDHIQISHVLKAMGVPLNYAKGTLRFSTGRFTTDRDIYRAVDSILRAIKKLRQEG